MSFPTGGALLVAYALLIGAPNKVIGAIAAVGPLATALGAGLNLVAGLRHLTHFPYGKLRDLLAR
jgi:hypothetical protein